MVRKPRQASCILKSPQASERHCPPMPANWGLCARRRTVKTMQVFWDDAQLPRGTRSLAGRRSARFGRAQHIEAPNSRHPFQSSHHGTPSCTTGCDNSNRNIHTQKCETSGSSYRVSAYSSAIPISSRSFVGFVKIAIAAAKCPLPEGVPGSDLSFSPAASRIPTLPSLHV